MTYLVVTIAFMGFLLLRTLFRTSPLRPPVAQSNISPRTTGIAPRPRADAQRVKRVISVDRTHSRIVPVDADPHVDRTHGGPHPGGLGSFYRTLYGPGLCSPR